MKKIIEDQAFLNFLLNHYLHEDNLIWNVLQLLILIQGAVIGGVYVIMEKNEVFLAVLLLVFGLFAKWLLALLKERYVQNREVNRELLEKVANDYLREFKFKEKFHLSNLKKTDLREMFSVKLYAWRILGWIFWLVFISDFVLFVLIFKTQVCVLFRCICC